MCVLFCEVPSNNVNQSEMLLTFCGYMTCIIHADVPEVPGLSLSQVGSVCVFFVSVVT